MTRREITMSGLADGGNGLKIQGFSRIDHGQNYPQHYPQSGECHDEPLGAPLSIRDVAGLIGCSTWTVRQRYLPQGLPHLRSGTHGKLVFFESQVIRWILDHQKKGGTWK